VNAGSEGSAPTTFFLGLGAPLSTYRRQRRRSQGVAVTMGKIIIGRLRRQLVLLETDSDWAQSAYTNIPIFTSSAKPVTTAPDRHHRPDYSPSAIHADHWVPVTVGSDAALAQSICQVILPRKALREICRPSRPILPYWSWNLMGQVFAPKRSAKAAGRRCLLFLGQAAGSLAERAGKSLALQRRRAGNGGSYKV